jgi:hypothetical protein
MKNVDNCLKLIFGIFLLFGCSEKEEDYGMGAYRVDWVEVKSPGVFALLDKRETTLCNTENTMFNNLKAGDRFILNYTYSDRPLSGYDYGIKINGITQVSCGVLKTLQGQNMSELKNDPVVFESVWIGRKYLNISFYVDATMNGNHRIDLYQSDVPHPDYPDAVYLLLRHDRNGDVAGSRKKANASFDIGSLGDAGLAGRVVLNIHPSNYRDSIIVVSKY